MTHPDFHTPSDPQTPDDTALDPWPLARRDYLSGVSAAIVAERYGLSVRTLQRRAAAEGWRHADVRPATRIRSDWNGPIGSFMREMIARDETLANRPEFAQVSAVAEEQRYDLLFAPTARNLRIHAFHQAAESAAMGGFAEATAWMRLLALVDRHAGVVDHDIRLYTPADHMRADYLGQYGALRAEHEDTPPEWPGGA